MHEQGKIPRPWRVFLCTCVCFLNETWLQCIPIVLDHGLTCLALSLDCELLEVRNSAIWHIFQRARCATCTLKSRIHHVSCVLSWQAPFGKNQWVNQAHVVLPGAHFLWHLTCFLKSFSLRKFGFYSLLRLKIV